MEKEQIQKESHNRKEICEMLCEIAHTCHADEEEKACQDILKEQMQSDGEDAVCFQKNQLNRIAGNLLLNYLEPKLIVAVMEGEDIREKLKLLQPRISSTKTRLERQVLQERQKMERQVVKYVMNFEADYHIMFRKIREEFMQLKQEWVEGPPLLMEEQIQGKIDQEEKWCMAQMREDIAELEDEISCFAKELFDIKMKCRQETIQIMDNSFFTMIAQKTERALKMIQYVPVVESVESIKHQMGEKVEDFGLTGFRPDVNKMEQLSRTEQEIEELLKKISDKVQQNGMRNEGKNKKSYNDFLKKYLDQLMQQLEKEATNYLEALEKQLTEATTGNQMRSHVDRKELQGLVDMRNRIAWTFEKSICTTVDGQ